MFALAPNQKIKPAQTFYIGDDFNILCFDENHHLNGHEYWEYMSKPHFNTHEEASAARDIKITAKIKSLEIDLAKIKSLIKKLSKE